MKSKTNLASSKSIKNPTQKLINLKCKQDHFAYRKQLPLKKNLSSYMSAYQEMDPAQNQQNQKIQALRKIIVPASLDQNLLRRSLHESRHFSQNKQPNLPSLKIGSTYKSSYLQKMNQKVVKGKQQDGFFIKMPWHQNPVSNYKKSYESMHVEQHLEKGIPNQDQIHVIRTPFKAHSNYEEHYSPLNNSRLQNNSKDCIKSKDHLTGVHCAMKGQSEYKSRFEKNKENLPSSKSIQSKKKINLFPSINTFKKPTIDDQLIPKKSLKMKKAESHPVTLQNQPSHKRMFTNIN